MENKCVNKLFLNVDLDSLNEKMRTLEHSYHSYSFPPNVLVEVSAHCNINCVQCAQSELTRKKGYMDIELYKKIVNEVAEHAPNTNFWFAFYGEPLLLKYKLFYMIQYAKARGLTQTYLNTNGMLLDEEMIELLIESGLDHIIVGIDGYSAEVFEKIRRKAKRDVVYDNVVKLKKRMEVRCSEKPRIEAQFIVMEENKHEIEQYLEFWKAHRIAVKIRNRVSWAGHVQEGKNIREKVERVACGWAIGTCPITWDGNMVACGADCNADYIFGNVKEQTIREVWNGKRKNFVENHLQHNFHRLPDVCEKCTDWQVIGTVDFDEEGILYKKIYK